MFVQPTHFPTRETLKRQYQTFYFFRFIQLLINNLIQMTGIGVCLTDHDHCVVSLEMITERPHRLLLWRIVLFQPRIHKQAHPSRVWMYTWSVFRFFMFCFCGLVCKNITLTTKCKKTILSLVQLFIAHYSLSFLVMCEVEQTTYGKHKQEAVDR